MKRTEFLSTLGIGLVAACAGCSKGSNTTPGGGGGGGGTPPPAGVNFTTDLNTEIKAVGESKVSSGVILVRVATGITTSSFTAVQLKCTHEGTSINFNNAQGNFVCPNHGSTFTSSGTVINGPATADLKKYKIAITGSVLTVTS